MPEVSLFYGIKIMMFFNEYERPHIHAKYAEHIAQISLSDLSVMSGELPKNAYRLIREWISQHQDELLEMYNTKNIHSIKPLE